MGIYLLAGIIFVLFVVFLIDFLRDSRQRDDDGLPTFRFPRYREEFGEDELYSYDDYRYRDYWGDDVEFGEDFDEETDHEEEDFHLNFKDEFGEDIMHDIPLDDLGDEDRETKTKR